MKHHKTEQPAALGINSVLWVGGTIGALQFQFLLNSGAAVSLIRQDKLPNSLCTLWSRLQCQQWGPTDCQWMWWGRYHYLFALQVLTVAISSDVEVPGRSVVTASGRLEGACLASSGLVEPHWHTGTPKHLLFARTISTVREGCVELQVKMFHGTKIGQLKPLEQVQLVDTVQEQTQHATPFPSDIDLSTSSLSAPQKEELLALLFQPCLCSVV